LLVASMLILLVALLATGLPLFYVLGAVSTVYLLAADISFAMLTHPSPSRAPRPESCGGGRCSRTSRH
jgi:hypothetical protein